MKKDFMLQSSVSEQTVSFSVNRYLFIDWFHNIGRGSFPSVVNWLIVQEYYEIVKTHLLSERGNINFLTADGNQEHNFTVPVLTYLFAFKKMNCDKILPQQ